jgi:hypothetical protein
MIEQFTLSRVIRYGARDILNSSLHFLVADMLQGIIPYLGTRYDPDVSAAVNIQRFSGQFRDLTTQDPFNF